MYKKEELLVEGSYEYLNKQKLYAQETFRLYRNVESKHLKLLAEIFSRLDNGGLLKIAVHMELNPQNVPIFQQIEKSLEQDYSLETFELDASDHRLTYKFQNATSSQDYFQTFSSKHYLSNPSFATSCFYTLTRNFDSTGRTTLAFISSDNEWQYQRAPKEHLLYGEFKVRTTKDYMLNGYELNASRLCLYQSDLDNSGATDIFISKHYAIPYELKMDDLQIKIKHLKKYEID